MKLDDERVQLIAMTIAAIPRGKVASYGQIARLAGLPNYARFVGSVLRFHADELELPWFRVVRSSGAFANGVNAQKQALLLSAEQVNVSDFRVNMRKFQWCPDGEATSTAPT